MTENAEKLTSENIPSEFPVGIKHPLLSRSPLGQKFLQPLGSKSISVLDLSLFSGQGGELQRFSDWESNFLVQSKPRRYRNEKNLQKQSLSSVNINPHHQVPELNPEKVNEGESEQNQNPANFNPDTYISTSEESQIRRELLSPLDNNSNIKKDYQTPNPKPYSSNVKPSKSTLFRAILGNQSPPSRNLKTPPPTKQQSEPIRTQPNSNSHSNQNINQSPFEADSPIIQEKSETSQAEEIQNQEIASENSSQIQQQSESSTGEISQAIASENSSQIQREFKTSTTDSVQRDSESSNVEERSNKISSENSSPIQRESEPLTTETHSDFPKIQQKSESYTEERPDEIASENSSPIQREFKTSTTDSVQRDSESFNVEERPNEIPSENQLSIQRESKSYTGEEISKVIASSTADSVQRDSESYNIEERSNEISSKNPLPIQRESESLTGETQSDFLAIQQQSESSTEEISQAIAEENLSPIQREPQTSTIQEISKAIASSTADSVQRDSESYKVEERPDEIAFENLPEIQRKSETSTTEEIKNERASENSPQIQRESKSLTEKTQSDFPTINQQSETSTGEKIQAIASTDLSSIQRESESTSNKSNLINERNETVGELIYNENSPKVQGVFENLAIQKKLINQQLPIQAKPTTNSSYKSRDLVPQSWSNVEELMGEEEKPEPNSNREQSRPKKPPKPQLFPDSTQVGAKGDIRSSQFENQPTPIKKLMQQTLANRGKLKEEVYSQKGHRVQPLNEQDLSSLEESVKTQNLEPVQKLDESKEEVVTSEHLEELAREIYNVICQRLQVERERYGFNNFSSRLPG